MKSGGGGQERSLSVSEHREEGAKSEAKQSKKATINKGFAGHIRPPITTLLIPLASSQTFRVVDTVLCMLMTPTTTVGVRSLEAGHTLD